VGTYVRKNKDAVFGTKRVDGYAYELEWAELTRKDYRLYLHILTSKKRFELLNIRNHVKRAYLLRDGREIPAVTNCT
jgi:alpha-L-fucosidase